MENPARLAVFSVRNTLNLVATWQGGVCLAFADEVFCWLYGTVKESEILNFMNLFVVLVVVLWLLLRFLFLLVLSEIDIQIIIVLLIVWDQMKTTYCSLLHLSTV